MRFRRRLFYSVCVIAFTVSFVMAPAAESGVASDGKAQNPPGLLFGSLVDNLKVNANGGWIKIGTNLIGVFLPENASGRMVLVSEGGKEIVHWPWAAIRGRFNPPFHRIQFRNALNPDGSQFKSSELRLTKQGRYRFDFFMSGKHFYSFPVQIKVLKPADLFGGNPKYLLIGDWNDWGYLNFADASPSSGLSWKLWLREWEFDQVPRSIEVELRRASDNALIAENRVRSTVRLRHDWERVDFRLFSPKDRSIFRASGLLSKDGDYRLEMKMNGTTYGEWKFSVKGGKLVPEGRTERGKTDPLNFIEGGRDAFWYKRVK